MAPTSRCNVLFRSDKRLTFAVKLEGAARLMAEANRRDHWATTARRAKAQRDLVGFVVAWLAVEARAYRIVVTRLIGPRGRPFDSDNLVGALKHVRDGIADGVGIDDRHDDRLEWTYMQARCDYHGVMVQLDALAP